MLTKEQKQKNWIKRYGRRLYWLIKDRLKQDNIELFIADKCKVSPRTAKRWIKFL